MKIDDWMTIEDKNTMATLDLASYDPKIDRHICKCCNRLFKTSLGCFRHIQNKHMDIVVSIRDKAIADEIESKNIEPKINQYMVPGERFNLYFAGKNDKEAFKQVIIELEKLIEKDQIKIKKV